MLRPVLQGGFADVVELLALRLWRTDAARTRHESDLALDLSWREMSVHVCIRHLGGAVGPPRLASWSVRRMVQG